MTHAWDLFSKTAATHNRQTTLKMFLCSIVMWPVSSSRHNILRSASFVFLADYLRAFLKLCSLRVKWNPDECFHRITASAWCSSVIEERSRGFWDMPSLEDDHKSFWLRPCVFQKLFRGGTVTEMSLYWLLGMLRRSSQFLILHQPLSSFSSSSSSSSCFLYSVLQKSLRALERVCFPTVSVLRPSVLLQLLLITSQSFMSRHKPPRLSAKPPFSHVVTPNWRRSSVLTSFTGVLDHHQCCWCCFCQYFSWLTRRRQMKQRANSCSLLKQNMWLQTQLFFRRTWVFCHRLACTWCINHLR